MEPRLDDRLGLTLAMSARAGARPEPGQAARMARRCALCTKTETCRLALIGGGQGGVPGYCLNRETIEPLTSRR